MNRKKYILVLSFIMIIACGSGIFIHPTNWYNNEATETIADKQIIIQRPSIDDEANFEPQKKDDMTLSVGKADVIPLENTEGWFITDFEVKDKDIIAIDDGGRIDALKEGETEVTIHYTNKKSISFKVTVKPAEEQNEDTNSTCITANQDIEQKNILNTDRLPYAIKVNRQMNTVTVYTYDSDGEYTVPVRAMVSSCGLNGATILGDYQLYFTSEWQALYNNVYGHYVSGIHGDFLFHSVPFYKNKKLDSLETEEFNKLGNDGSLGCVRLAVADSKWIFEHCAMGTAITIYDDDNPGPLGKPETIKISDLSCGWDPTDSDKRNPYNKKAPEISGAEDIELELGEGIDLTENIKAIDTCSNDITDKVEVIGNVLISRKGTYKVTYTVKDALHRTAAKDITVTVK